MLDETVGHSCKRRVTENALKVYYSLADVGDRSVVGHVFEVHERKAPWILLEISDRVMFCSCHPVQVDFQFD